MREKRIPRGPLHKFIAVDLSVIVMALALAFFIKFQELREENLTIYFRLFVLIAVFRLGLLFMFRLYDFSRGLTLLDIIYFTGCAMVLAHGMEALAILYTETYHNTSTHPPTTSYIMEEEYHPPPPELWRESNYIPWPPGNEKFASNLPAWTVSHAERKYQISRHILILNFLLSWIGAAGWRILYLERRKRWAYDRTRMLIVGAGEVADNVFRDIHQYSRLGHEVIGLVDDDFENPKAGAAILGKMKNLGDLVETHRIDEILVTSQRANRQELLEIISACQATERRVLLLPELYEVTIGKVEIGQVAGVPFIALNSEPMSEWGVFVKRAFDLIVSSAITVFFSPFAMMISAAIKWDSPGPVWFRQERIGKDGRPFTVFKFRTMRQDAEAELGPVLSWDNDPRVTRVGRFLRRWHLDELPQLINVLRGEMSLVGPRPERPHFARQYEEAIPVYRLRERVRPGITGLGQIHGFYTSPVEHKLRYDLAYINSMSFLLDLKILLLTLRVTLTDRGNIPTNHSQVSEK